MQIVIQPSPTVIFDSSQEIMKIPGSESMEHSEVFDKYENSWGVNFFPEPDGTILDDNAYYQPKEFEFFSIYRDSLIRFIEQLATMVNFDFDYNLHGAKPRTPFRELFWIGRHAKSCGPKLTSLIAAEFADWDAYAWFTGTDEFYETYRFFHMMFEYAGTSGAVGVRSC